VISLSFGASRLILALDASTALVGVDAVSGTLPPLRGLPRVDLAGSAALDPDVVIVDALPPGGVPRELQAAGTRIFEFVPHDLEDVQDMIRELGGVLVGPQRAHVFEVAFSEPFARIGGASHGQPRPRVVAVLSFDPLEIAGGHSFETDLIEIAGGESVTHAIEEPRLHIEANAWALLAPDLVWVVDEPPSVERPALREVVPSSVDVVFLSFAPDFWLDEDPTFPVRRLRGVIEPLSRRLD
jgi:ABC-type hemin transport system substrate-binding protein